MKSGPCEIYQPNPGVSLAGSDLLRQSVPAGLCPAMKASGVYSHGGVF